MCGIAGILNLSEGAPIEEPRMRRMLAAIRHRGPDEFGIYLDSQIALGSARLSILDLSAGQQPIANEDETLWIVFNGEIFNYEELRPDLKARGHRFTTATDTEVLLHLYEEFGPACLEHLNGQFAIAIWDTDKETLFLARDRLGVRPLYYTISGRKLIFASEIKAILSSSLVAARINPVAMDQIFTFWSTLSPRTVFSGIREVPPGSYLLARNGSVQVRRYWQLGFEAAEPAREFDSRLCLEEFRYLLEDATRIRLRADVPVGAYLSGGLDSSTIAALVRRQASSRLDTFSISFDHPDFDESEFQRRMARFLGTNHQVISVADTDIGRVFPEVIWHTETPVMRTAPAPMFLLSRLAHERGYKVVLTGEGADEFLAGYEIFKEAAVRRFCARQPSSLRRPLLFERLYPDISGLARVNGEFRAAFFRAGLDPVSAPDYSHAIRWRNNRRSTRFFAAGLVDAVRQAAPNPFDSIEYPPGFQAWGPLERAQYLESSIFLSQYLLASQGDRMAMAHSVEGRFPFLDHRVIKFCTRLPSGLKLNGMKEKFLLKKLGRELLPEEIWRRPKRPYRAPIHRAFFNGHPQDYVNDLLSPSRLTQAGLFHPAAVSGMLAKLERGLALGEADDMALAGIISSQLVMEQFVWNFRAPEPLGDDVRLKLCVRNEVVRSR